MLISVFEYSKTLIQLFYCIRIIRIISLAWKYVPFIYRNKLHKQRTPRTIKVNKSVESDLKKFIIKKIEKDKKQNSG